MRIDMAHPLSATGTVPLLGNPIKMSATPPAYTRPPPYLGPAHGRGPGRALALDEPELASLREAGVIA